MEEGEAVRGLEKEEKGEAGIPGDGGGENRLYSR